MSSSWRRVQYTSSHTEPPALDGGEWSTLQPGHLSPEKNKSRNNNWVDSRTGVDFSRKGNNSDFCWEANLGWSSLRPVAIPNTLSPGFPLHSMLSPASPYTINNIISKVYSDKFEFSILNPVFRRGGREKKRQYPKCAASTIWFKNYFLFYPTNEQIQTNVVQWV